MPHFSMLVQTEANAGLDDGNMVHARVIEIILCIFLTYPIIYQLGTVYYYKSPFQYHIITYPQMLCWFSKGYI